MYTIYETYDSDCLAREIFHDIVKTWSMPLELGRVEGLKQFFN